MLRHKFSCALLLSLPPLVTYKRGISDRLTAASRLFSGLTTCNNQAALYFCEAVHT